ncbi:2'-5' RNA ligase family protein [Kineococcus siccus]|uniref:2'-5' RNA ligase family protein n=1 Tax=Kineococcus siccus TaxID=2696567 RepID=UPI00196AAED6
MSAPLVLALALADADAERLDALRERHFPPERNQLRAHVTLFHQLPGEELPTVLEQVGEACRREQFGVDVTGVRSLGRGAALVLRSAELDALRADLARRFSPWLTRQDAQRFAAHVTVANFLAPAAARALVADLGAGFTPWTVAARGVAVHRYLGGPWELVDTVPLLA